MKDLIAFASYVRPEVPACPEIQILDAIRRSGEDFCKRTSIARLTVTVNTMPAVASYDLSVLLPLGYLPDEVERVQYPSYGDLEASSEDDFDRKYLSDAGSISHYYLDGRNLIIGHKPLESVALTVRVKVRISADATQLPDELYDRYREEIAAGAKKTLMMMANVPWSNIQQAAIYKNEFETAIDQENLRYAKGGGSRRLRTRLQTF